MSTPKKAGQYSDYEANPTLTENGTYSFIKAINNHSFPEEEMLVYQWDQTVSGWTGIFVFLAIVVMCIVAFVTGGAALSAMGVLNIGIGNLALAGAAVGAIGGLMATGFSPSTSITADITPFSNSSYQLDPSHDASGDALAVANNTRDQWVTPDIANTPGGVQTYVSKIDIRKALACGGDLKATDACATPAVQSIGMDDPRFNQAYQEMFYFSNKELQKYKYPYQ